MSRHLVLLLVCVCWVISVVALLPPGGLYPIDRELARRFQVPPSSKRLGGILTSSPHCLSRDGLVVHCFFVTDNNSVGYARIEDGSAEFKDFGGAVVEQPQTVGYGASGVFAHFVTGYGYVVVAAAETGTEYDNKATELSSLGIFVEAPGCVTLERQDSVFCVIRRVNGDMCSFKFIDGRWIRPIRVTENPNAPLTCVLNTVAHSIHCWSTDHRNILAERLFSDEGVPLLPVWLTQDQRARGRVLVKMLGFIPLPRALSFDSRKMIDIWGNFGGELFSEPDCASSDSQSLDCFALDSKNGIQRIYQRVGMLYVRRTSGWLHYKGSFVGKPSCLYLKADRKLHCYIRNDEDALMDIGFETNSRYQSLIS